MPLLRLKLPVLSPVRLHTHSLNKLAQVPAVATAVPIFRPGNASCAACFRAFRVFRRRLRAPEGAATFFSCAWGAENLRAGPAIITRRKAEDEEDSDSAVGGGHAAGRGLGRVGHRLQGQGAVADGFRRGRHQIRSARPKRTKRRKEFNSDDKCAANQIKVRRAYIDWAGLAFAVTAWDSLNIEVDNAYA